MERGRRRNDVIIAFSQTIIIIKKKGKSRSKNYLRNKGDYLKEEGMRKRRVGEIYAMLNV